MTVVRFTARDKPFIWATNKLVNRRLRQFDPPARWAPDSWMGDFAGRDLSARLIRVMQRHLDRRIRVLRRGVPASIRDVYDESEVATRGTPWTLASRPPGFKEKP